VNVRPIAAYRRTQKSSLQLGQRVGGHLALTDFVPEEPQWTLVDDSTINIVVVMIMIMIIIIIIMMMIIIILFCPR